MLDQSNKKAILMILDGWGIAKDPSVSAISKAKTPFIDSCYKNYPHTSLQTSGEAVGLPKGQMGNSEVGHMHLGAGRIIYQNLVKINRAIENNTLKDNEALNKAFDYALKNDRKIHFLGLLSNGGVHSHINHLLGLLDLVKARGLKKVFIHAFSDGRDTDPKTAKGHIQTLLDHIKGSEIKLASLMGRYYAMDRDNRWERIKLAYDALIHAKGTYSKDLMASIENSYKEGINDEFIKPIIALDANENPLTVIEDKDVVICFNFRTDRLRELSEVLSQRDLLEYQMHKLDLHYVTMVPYSLNFKGVEVIFKEEKLVDTLGEILSKKGKKQIRIAETEKYPHVTFFFSGGKEEPFKGEERILCPSPKVATYDLAPQMSAYEIKDRIIIEIQKKEADFICLNFANPDMVGHSGIMQAAIKACEVVDECAEVISQEALKNGYALFILADHGNADCMVNADGTPHTAHTTQPVPLFFLHPTWKPLLKEGTLVDIAPTILTYMGIEPSEFMTGQILLK